MESIGVFVQWCLDHLNYWTITLLMTIESSAIPFPSEIVVPPAAYHAAATGEMNILLIIFFATLGALLGATINYFISLWVGRPIIYRFADSRLGHLIMLDGSKVQRAEEYFNQHGNVSTLVGRLIPVIRQLISVPAGLARMNYAKFAAYTSLGAAIWNTVLTLLGYYLERVVPEDELVNTVTKYSHEIGFGIISVVIVALAVIFFKKRGKKNPDKNQ
ncbi:MAG: DedA family protein [Bacteroidaceae bacterium]|nr:DedA family protein [Bacteroidaceae bacterium]